MTPDERIDGLARAMMDAGSEFAKQNPALSVRESVRGAFLAWERISEKMLNITHPPSRYDRLKLPPAPKLPGGK